MLPVSVAWFRRNSISALLAAVLLAGFVAFLIGETYRSQKEVRQFAMSDLRTNLDKRAAAVSYFFSERRNDLRDLAAGSEISAFFENEALGMTMEYGLKASLGIISESFEKILQEHWLGEDPIYENLALIDSSGKPLVDVALPGRGNNGAARRGELSETPDQDIVVEAGSESCASIFAPCYLKDRRAGLIVARMPLQTVYDHFLKRFDRNAKRGSFLFSTTDDFNRPLKLVYPNSHLLESFLGFAAVDSTAAVSSGPVNAGSKSGAIPMSFFRQFNGYAGGATDGEARPRFFEKGVEMLVVCAAVPDTPFSLVDIIPAKEVFGNTEPWHLLAALGALALLLFGGTVVIWRSGAKTLVLQTRLEETSERERAIAMVNRELRIGIAERKKAENALQKSENRYRDLFDNISDFIYTHDLEGRFLTFNPAMAAMLGYPPEEITGRCAADFMPEQYKEAFFTEYLPAVKSRGSFDYTVLLLSSDGSGHFVECRNSLVEEGGAGVYVRGSGRDVTERRHYETELEKAKEAAEAASRAKSDFLSNMNHELRTPLNVIIGFTELILDKQCGDLTPQQEECLGDVMQSARGLLLLINDILDLTKIESGKLELELSQVQLSELLARILSLLKEKALKHNIRLAHEEKDVPEFIVADERKLKQVIYNLLANAVKFTPDGGRVLLKSESENGFVRISIEDNGVGIKKEDLERIFDPFEQADGSLSRRFQGTGLGLSLTKSMVQLHGGKIWAESGGEGKGSRFSFIIPVVQPDVDAMSDIFC